MSEEYIELKSLSFAHGKRIVLRDLSCRFASGQISAILGANGSGKTTLLNLLSGFQPLQRGEIWAYGNCVARHRSVVDSRLRTRTGVVFQEPSLDPHLSVNENLLLSGRLYGLTGKSLHDAVTGALDWIELSHRAHDPVKTLSGGMKKKIEFVRALLHLPDLLFLDEATSGLDYFACNKFWQKIEERKKGGATIVMVTHRMDEIEKCDNVVMIHDGRVVAQGSPKELLKSAGGERVSIQLRSGFNQLESLAIAQWPGVEKYFVDPGVGVDIIACNGQVVASRISLALESNSIRSITVRPPTVADAYLSITGVHLDSN